MSLRHVAGVDAALISHNVADCHYNILFYVVKNSLDVSIMQNKSLQRRAHTCVNLQRLRTMRCKKMGGAYAK